MSSLLYPSEVDYRSSGDFSGLLFSPQSSTLDPEEYDLIWSSNSSQNVSDLNSTLFDPDEVEPDWGFIAWLKLFFLLSIIVLTVVGNLLVCISVILVKKLRKPQNYLLMSLAVSDLLVAVCVLPFAIINEMNHLIWPLNTSWCEIWVLSDVLLCTSSILSLCAISVDRYRAITKPLEYSAATTPQRMLCIILGVWLGSACVSLPPVLLLGNEHYTSTGIKICLPSQNFWYQIWATMASFYIPLIVMICVYVKILRVVADKKKQMNWKQSSHRNGSSHRSTQQPLIPPSPQSSVLLNGSPSNQSQIINKNVTVNGQTYLLQSTTKIQEKRVKKDKLLDGLREHKASTTLGIIMTAFIVCWLPFFVLALIRPFHSRAEDIPNWISSLVLWLGYANSGLNPIIYATLNRDFRKPFKEILCFRCSTLDSLMKKEFYNHQFGDDPENRVRRKQSSVSGPRNGDCPVDL